MQGHVHITPTSRRASTTLPLWLGCIAVAGLGVLLFISGGRRSSAVEALPVLLFLLCPALHFLHHVGHGHHRAEQRATSNDKGERT